MIVTDMQPFSIVDDERFREFVHGLDPTYVIPSRTTLSRHHLPAAYDDAVTKMKEKLREVDAVGLTTDSWTSRSTENYIAVTAHYVTTDYALESCLLECFKYSERHTADNLYDELKRVACDWQLADKVVSITTDNAANITAAVRMTGWKHLPCFAHTLNLVVQSGMAAMKPVHDKVKAIVEFFHRSTTAAEKLRQLQQQLSPEQQPLKLVNDVPTRWNSTFYMLKRIAQVLILSNYFQGFRALIHRTSVLISFSVVSVLNGKFYSCDVIIIIEILLLVLLL